MVRQRSFLGDFPEGFAYREGFVSEEEERKLVEVIGRVPFASFEMRGVVARRRVAFFGHTYDPAREAIGPIPEFLFPVRARAASWAGVQPEEFAMALINAYPPGAPIGWHRDAPQYGLVAGISLLSACRMRLRPYLSPGEAARRTGGPLRRATHEVTLDPRSAYLLTGAARSRFEHSIPAVTELRYSITFRTLRGRPTFADPTARARPGR